MGSVGARNNRDDKVKSTRSRAKEQITPVGEARHPPERSS